MTSSFLEALEAFDGVMLGDGAIRRNGMSASFILSKSGEDKMDYLHHVKGVLNDLGVRTCLGHPKSGWRVDMNGRSYLSCYIETTDSAFMLEQYSRWYHPGTGRRKTIKVVPDRLKMSPTTLAHHFMDDGGTSWIPPNSVILLLATNNFTRNESTLLRDLILESLDISMSVHSATGSWRLQTARSLDVNRFLDLVESQILPCYKYKVKRPWLKVLDIEGRRVRGPFIWKEGGWTKHDFT